MVVIIGVMVAFVTVKLSRDLDRLARLEAQRFMAVVNEVRDESIIAGDAFVLTLDNKASVYRFSGVRDGRTGNLSDGLLKGRKLQTGLKLDWEVFETIEEEEGDEVSDKPRVFISPLGEITPFDARFIGDELEYHVFVNDDNQLEQRNEKARLF